MDKKESRESLKYEINVEIENLLNKVIAALKVGGSNSERIAEQLIRDDLNERLFLGD